MLPLRHGSSAPDRLDFLRPGSKWHRHLKSADPDDYRLWEIAILFHLRDGLRSGNLWLAQSRRFGDMKQVLVSQAAAPSGGGPGQRTAERAGCYPPQP